MSFKEYADSMKAIIILFTMMIVVQFLLHIIKFLRYRQSVNFLSYISNPLGSPILD